MSRRVEIRHPGYPAPNILFSFPANDGANRDRAHYPTVLAAGAIFTETQSGLWLSSESSGDSQFNPDEDELMPAGEYFLHVLRGNASDAGPYPITANFRAWHFPNAILLPLWQSITEETLASQSTMVPELLINEPCRITNKHLACENAHIIPASEKAWFLRNEMDRYGRLGGRSGEAVADSVSNLVRLTRDAHWLWDTLHISVVPRVDPASGNAVAWFTQMLVEDEELYLSWHRRKLQSLQGRAPQYLFARFAWDIFPKLHTFLQAGQPRRLAVRQPDGKVNVRMYSAHECRDFTLGQGRGRSASPTKRPRSDADNVDDDILEAKNCRPLSASHSFDSAVADLEESAKPECRRRSIDPAENERVATTEGRMYPYWNLDGEEQEEERGRKRRRSVSP